MSLIWPSISNGPSSDSVIFTLGIFISIFFRIGRVDITGGDRWQRIGDCLAELDSVPRLSWIRDRGLRITLQWGEKDTEINSA
jgi:hypothetical protein